MRVYLRGAAVIVFTALFIAGCSPSSQDIGETVKVSMQQKFDSDAQFKKWHLQVRSVQAVKQDGNRYQGVAAVVYKGTSHDVPVDITADGSNVIWKTDPGGFVFVSQNMLQNLQDIFQ